MRDFTYYAPTEVAFGKDSESKIGPLVSKYNGKKVLLHYGGKSAERSGLLDVVRASLRKAGAGFVELGGVVPNPLLSKVREGIDLCRKEKVDFILAVGGGSVIDSSKAIAIGVPYNGDVWDFFTGKAEPDAALPLGVILTIPAAGSEMSDSLVITNGDGGWKRSCGSYLLRPKFAVMNPVRTFTLPPFQTACGITDMIMHTMERYFSLDDDMTITDNLAEALIRTVMDMAPRVLANPEDYHARAQIMWSGSLAHNDLTGCGTTGDWATHDLEHELSGMFDVAHGAGLAALWGSWARYVKDCRLSRFVRFAVNVMGVPNDFTDPEGTALRGIEAMERFFAGIGMPTSIHELIGREISDGELAELARKASNGGTTTVGSFRVLKLQDMENIYKMAK